MRALILLCGLLSACEDGETAPEGLSTLVAVE